MVMYTEAHSVQFTFIHVQIFEKTLLFETFLRQERQSRHSSLLLMNLNFFSIINLQLMLRDNYCGLHYSVIMVAVPIQIKA